MVVEVSEAAKSDIFISYAREDVTRVGLLVAALQAEGWTVFWDREILPGDDWESHVGVHLSSAPVVIAVWSSHSLESRYVKSEVNRAFKRKAVVPVLIDAVEPPLGFDHIHAADLVDWLAKGGGTLPIALRASISRRVLPSAAKMPAAEVGGSSMPAAEVGGSTNEPRKVHPPLVWLCYAKSDASWVKALASSRWLKASLGDCWTMDAIDDDGPSSLSLLDPIVAVLFISKSYFTENKPLWYTRLTDVQLNAVTFFPILTDTEARQWYSSLRFRNVGSQQSIDPIDFTGALGLRLDVRSDSPMIVARVTDLATTLNLLLDKLRRRRRRTPAVKQC